MTKNMLPCTVGIETKGHLNFHPPSPPSFSQKTHTHTEPYTDGLGWDLFNNYKDTKPLISSYWCLIEFIDWRYS